MLSTSTRLKAASRHAAQRRVAVIDVGSNSVRLVVHDMWGRAFQQRFNEKVLAGLGRGLGASGRLHPEGVEMAVAALRRFRAITRAQKADAVLAFATAAVREASDGQAFCERVRREAGLTLRVLSGDEEARLAAEGVLAGAPDADGVVGDLGGSSLELARVRKGRYVHGQTFPLGPLALDAGGGFSEEKVGARVRQLLAGARELAQAEGAVFFAVGGAWRSIASIHMELTKAPLHMLQNYEMDAASLATLLPELIAGKKHAKLVQDVAKRRVDTIPYAAAVLAGVLEIGRFRSVMISSFGVREGIVFESLSEAERARDPLEAGLDAFGVLDDHSAEFGAALADWLAEAASHTLPARLARAACRLADIGARLHPDNRADLVFDLVARAPLPGLAHRDRAALALAVATRYGRAVRNVVAETLLDGETAGRARALGALMRLGADFSGRTSELLAHASLHCDGETLELRVSHDQRTLASEAVQRRLQQAALELGMDYAMSV
jgi:exopolyphosphatase / guanosine-5'-triphosphate,3'-diphosphate pyrophosphatase